MTKRRLRIFGSMLAASAIAVLATSAVQAQEDTAPDIPETIIDEIVRCLSQGKEVVMAPQRDCVFRGSGEHSGDHVAKHAHMPLGDANWDGDWNKVCRDQNDSRRLPADVIKRIAANKTAAIAPSGIRIIGAVFCGNPHGAALDLAGLDLPYSLVIDRSVVNGYVDARNLRVKGDFSFDYAVILDSLRLNRARVEGSVYGNGSFMDQLFVSDTQINGSWIDPESVVFSDAQFLRSKISGELSMNGSALSRLWVFSSSIAGTLDLNDTQARCAYHINSSSAGYLTAARAGFGVMRPTQPSGSVDYAWWASARLESYARSIFQSPAIARIVAAKMQEISGSPGSRGSDRSVVRGCEETTNSPYFEFYVFDSTVQAAFCLTSFAWPTPKQDIPDDAHPTTIIAIDGTKVLGNLIVKLWSEQPSAIANLKPASPDYRRVSSKHKFEAIGLSALAFIFDFGDNERPYLTYLDGLKFDRVHKATPACTNESGSKLASQVELPSIDDVLTWLSKNAASSSQPFTAFAAAFEQAGESATRLRVKRQTIDLCQKTIKWLPFIEPLCPGHELSNYPSARSNAVAAGPRQTGALSRFGEIFSDTGEIVTISFQWMLFLLADHGLRPGKVVWSVGFTLLGFSIWFWFVLGIVGFEPKSKDNGPPAGHAPAVWPISFLFLFDRMIPAYKIREEHYAIAKVYRRATADEIDGAPRPQGGAPYPMHYLGRKYLVSPAGDVALRRLEKWIVVLRIIGAIFAVFLLAAVNALVH